MRNPIHAVANVDDYGASARLLAATTLRNVLGTLNLGDILSQREIIAKEMQVSVCVCAVSLMCLCSNSIKCVLLPRIRWWRAQQPGECRWRGSR